jgi:AbiV family abortive infection protein
LSIYQRLIAHVRSLWKRGCDACIARDYPISVFFAILAIEETGKMGRLWFDLLAWDRPDPEPKSKALARKHPQKHFLGLVPGAVVNARLDRILGAKEIKRVLEDAESGRLERRRQSCLYVDVVDNKPVLPDDIITEEQARFLTVLAGEIWAEILGHFPWDFEAMIGEVIEYELRLGFPPELVRQG